MLPDCVSLLFISNFPEEFRMLYLFGANLNAEV